METATQKQESTTVTFGSEQLGNISFYATQPMALKNDAIDEIGNDLKPVKAENERIGLQPWKPDISDSERKKIINNAASFPRLGIFG